ncbi:hypothetical protein BMETH_838_2 [methanotrophic bacterial endosymbiont of Bathymodiolus sp.]|nr:hypothetical protein BMETH_838_2 [methanotrophic bacterial endosymbiont of Bathymodiolus sp.]
MPKTSFRKNSDSPRLSVLQRIADKEPESEIGIAAKAQQQKWQ